MHFPIITCLVHRVLSATKWLRNVTCSETSIICSLFWAVHSFCSRWALDEKNKKNQTFWAGSRTRTPLCHCQLGKRSQNPSLQQLSISSSLRHSPSDPICILIILPSAKVRVQTGLTCYYSTFHSAFCSFQIHTVLLWSLSGLVCLFPLQKSQILGEEN